jgi:hypothetical protein
MSVTNLQTTLLTFTEQRRPRPYRAESLKYHNSQRSCILNVRPLHNETCSHDVPTNAIEVVKLSIRMWEEIL